MLTDFLELTGTLEYEEHGWSTITSADWNVSDLILLVRVRVPGSPDRLFWVSCSQPRSYQVIAMTTDQSVLLTSEHAVLWPHNQKQGELYFNGTASDATSLLGALIESQREVVGDWFPIDRFLNLPGRSADILRSGHGLLATGPVMLLDRYASVLDNYGIRHSSPSPREPVWWNGGKWQPESDQLYALIIGSSFVVAPSFTERAG